MSFTDVETGEPVIADVMRVDDEVGRAVPQRLVLPDLVVLWSGRRSAQESGGVRSERFGEIRWPKGARLRSGRSGNHTHHGWFVAAGPGVRPGRSNATYDTVDLLPTAFAWMGAAQPDFFHGQPIAELACQAIVRVADVAVE
jgi:hypothetical protein